MKRVALTSALALLLCGRVSFADAPPPELRIVDANGAVLPPTQTRASFSRTLPPELGGRPGPDEDELRFLVVGPPDSVAEEVGAVTLDARGAPLDALVALPTEPSTCPDGVAPELVCRETLPLRLVTDGLERSHPALSRRSLRAELGGVLRVSLGRETRFDVPVGGPRELGEPGGYRARLRVMILRNVRGGPPALGGSDAEAKRIARRELRSASDIWSQCGIDLVSRSTVEVVDPPVAALLNLGCSVGQPASGGVVSLSVAARPVRLQTRAGETPVAVALRLAEALKVGSKLPRVLENQRATGLALPSADLVLERADATRVVAATSTDPTLPICVGRVNLSDGLTHFGDGDAFAGTLEERALLRALDDGDSRSVEVLVIPAFERGERIGESFIASSGSSLSNAVIVDRAAIAAGARSFALAHELGHVLLAMPGHPDDFGVDQSWALMDSDVADATIFGPRRLSLGDCRRAVTQTGPSSPVPILEPFSLK